MKRNKNKGILFWITGLSGSGKTQIAKKIHLSISKKYGPTVCFSGDEIRKTFDSKGYNKSESFDHGLLENVPNELNKMIAGNIQINDIPNFKDKDFIIDLSGALEDQNGKKDINKINKLLNLFEKI